MIPSGSGLIYDYHRLADREKIREWHRGPNAHALPGSPDQRAIEFASPIPTTDQCNDLRERLSVLTRREDAGSRKIATLIGDMQAILAREPTSAASVFYSVGWKIFG